MKNTDEQSISVNTMPLERIIDNMGGIRDNAESFLHTPLEPDDEIWLEDIRTVDAAVMILSALREEGIVDAEQVKDLLHDYRLANKELKELQRKYQTPAWPDRSGTLTYCPECHRKLAYSAKHCGQCGKLIAGR